MASFPFLHSIIPLSPILLIQIDLYSNVLTYHVIYLQLMDEFFTTLCSLRFVMLYFGNTFFCIFHLLCSLQICLSCFKIFIPFWIPSFIFLNIWSILNLSFLQIIPLSLVLLPTILPLWLWQQSLANGLYCGDNFIS